MFDAGTIVAKMDVDTTAADKKLDKFDDRVKGSEKEHKVKLSAVFDEASIGKARMLFAQLDNAISKDAANRLRSSPQGSVLGALNALFSPHPVTGAPNPAQSASQGLLGKVAQQQGRNVPATAGTSSPSGGTSQTAQTASEHNNGTNQTVEQSARRGGLLGGLLSRIGGGGGGGSGFLSHIGGMGAGQAAGGLLNGIGPNILGLSTKMTAGVGGIGSLLGALPGLGGVAGVGLGVALIGGLTGVLAAKNPKIKTAFSAIGPEIMKSLETAFQPMVPFILKIVSQIEPLIKSITPALTSIFKVVGPQLGSVFKSVSGIIKGLVDVMSAAAPAFGPFINGLLSLVKNILPPLASGIKATVPFISAFGYTLGQIGKDLGSLFGSAGPAIKSSMVILNDLLRLIGSLLPTIMKLGSIFAVALAPVFTSFGKAIESLLPFLGTLGQVVGALAGAILGDLASAFTAVASLLTDLAPSLNILAKTLESVFAVLENSGVFAILGDALEEIAKPLAGLINALVIGLAPALPPLIQAVSQISSLLVGALGRALTQILVVLTPVISFLAKLIAGFIGWLQQAHLLIPVMILVAAYFFPISTAIALLVLGIEELATHWHEVWTNIKNWAADAWNFLTHGWGQFLFPGLTLILDAIKFLADHWTAIWGTIEQVAKNFWTWLWTDFGQKIFVFLVQTLPGWFGSLEKDIQKYFGDAVTWLVQGGKNIITGLWDGIKDIWTTVTGWFGSLPHTILHALGINSPPAWAISAGRDIMQGLGIGVTQGKHHVTTAMAGIASVAAAAAGAVGGSIQSLMQQMAAARGWTGPQWTALYNVEMAEAGFNLNAKNPGSGAYGLAQFINGPSEYAQYGGNATSAAGQITGMLNYIAQRYGNPQAAWAHESAFHWYDQGGWLQPGVAVNMTGHGEAVLTPTESQAFVAMAQKAESGGWAGALLRDVYFQLPEGATIAQAMQEITFRLKVAQQGYAGGMNP